MNFWQTSKQNACCCKMFETLIRKRSDYSPKQMHSSKKWYGSGWTEPSATKNCTPNAGRRQHQLLSFAIMLCLCHVSTLAEASWTSSLAELVSRLTEAGEFPAASLQLLPCGTVSDRALTSLLRRLSCPRGCTVASRCRPCHEQLVSSLYDSPGGALLFWAGSDECLQVSQDRLPTHWAGASVLLLPPEDMPCPEALAVPVFIKVPFSLCASLSAGAWHVWRRVTPAVEAADIRLVARSSRNGIEVIAPALPRTPTMRGATLRVRFLNNYPYVYCTSLTANDTCVEPLTRPETNLLSVLSEHLNFSAELRQHPRRIWGNRDANGTWHGLLGSVVRDEADMAIGGVSVSAARAGAVDFLHEFALVRSVFVTHRPPPLPPYQTVTAPLHPSLWVLIVLSLLLVAAVLALQRACRYDLALLEVFKIILGQDLCREVTTASNRLFTGMWMLTAFVIACVYTSKLTSFLINGVPGRPVETLEQLAASSYKLAVSPNNKIFLEWLDESRGATFAKLRTKLVIEPDINNTLRLSGPEHRYAHVFEDFFFQYVLAWMIRLEDGSLQPYDFVVSRDSFMPTPLAMAVQKNAPYRRHMDRAILRLASAGIIQKWIADKLHKKRRQASRIVACLKDGVQCRGDEEETPIGMQHLEAPFRLLLLGYMLAALMLCGELASKGIPCGRWEKLMRLRNSAQCSKKTQQKLLHYQLLRLNKKSESLPEIRKIKAHTADCQKMDVHQLKSRKSGAKVQRVGNIKCTRPRGQKDKLTLTSSLKDFSNLKYKQAQHSNSEAAKDDASEG